MLPLSSQFCKRRDADFTRRNTELLAKLGYVVFAPDIYGKTVRPKTVPEFVEQSKIYNADRPLMRARAQAGLDVLRQSPMVDAGRLGVIGYCFGGTVAVEFGGNGRTGSRHSRDPRLVPQP